MHKPNLDLKTVDPNGRVDVLAYRGAMAIAKYAEEKIGMKGLAGVIEPHVNSMVAANMKNVSIPTEVEILLKLMQANM